jgi:nucleotidyltransferase AbiEii toxin of type IV toxin-antitoxin system
VSSTGKKSDWMRLLRVARSMIRQVNVPERVVDYWTLGGGTALMLRIDHRESRDIDIFLSDPQQLGFFDPARRDFDFEISPSAHRSGGARFRKFVFPTAAEIDFIVGGPLTIPGATVKTIEGESLSLETAAEVIAKKVQHRGSAIAPRDIFDIAAAGEKHADAIIRELRKLRIAVGHTISALDSLDSEFVNQVISELAIKPAYQTLARTAGARAKEILRAV